MTCLTDRHLLVRVSVKLQSPFSIDIHLCIRVSIVGVFERYFPPPLRKVLTGSIRPSELLTRCMGWIDFFLSWFPFRIRGTASVLTLPIDSVKSFCGDVRYDGSVLSCSLFRGFTNPGAEENASACATLSFSPPCLSQDFSESVLMLAVRALTLSKAMEIFINIVWTCVPSRNWVCSFPSRAAMVLRSSCVIPPRSHVRISLSSWQDKTGLWVQRDGIAWREDVHSLTLGVCQMYFPVVCLFKSFTHSLPVCRACVKSGMSVWQHTLVG